MNEEKRSEAPAYVSWKTFLSATAQMDGRLPPRIDSSVFPTYSGGTTSQLLSAFRFLGFTEDDGTVCAPFRSWVEEPEQRPQMLKAILTDKYAELLDLADQNATPMQMQAFFKETGITGSTLRKATTFFVKACEFASIDVPATWARAPGSPSPKAGGARKRRANTKAEDSEQVGKTTPQDEGDVDRVTLHSGGTVTLSVATNLTRLSSKDREWLFGLIDKFRSYESEGPDEE